MKSRCTLCGSQEYRVLENANFQPSQVERLILDIAALVGIQVQAHRVRLAECLGCNPGRVSRHRELLTVLETEYGKSYLQRRGEPPLKTAATREYFRKYMRAYRARKALK